VSLTAKDAPSAAREASPPAVDEPVAPVRRATNLRELARAYLVEGALLGVFFVQAVRHLWISDDGYIYLTYIRNFTENGAGPVLNAHQHVEGFTSVGWFAILSVLDFLRPDGFLDLRKVTIMVSLVLSLGALATWCAIERRAAPRRLADTRPVLNLPLAVLACMFAVYSFATSGLETPLEFVYLAAFVLYVYRRSERFAIAAVLVGFAPLVRPDFALFGALLFFRYVRRKGPHPWRLVAVSLVPIAIVTVVRVWYYGALLPNTYYAKTGTPYGFGDGYHYVREFALSYGAQWILAAAFAVVVGEAVVARRVHAGSAWRVVQPLRDERQFLLVCGLLSIGYVMSVGGDFMHGRFLLPALFMVLGVLAGIGTRALTWMRSDSVATRRVVGAIATAGIAIVLATSVPVANALSARKNIEFRGIDNQERALEANNPDLHHFFGAYMGTWGRSGAALREFADRAGTEVGVTAGAIGERSYQAKRDGGNVYLFDLLGLTNVAGSRIDMEGRRVRRVGAAKTAPLVLVDDDPRVDFAYQDFAGYNTAFRVQYGAWSAPLVNFDLLPRLVERGLVTPQRAEQMRDWIRARLAAPTISRNLVHLLDERYHERDDIRATLDRLHALATQSQWARWLRDHHDTLELLQRDAPSGGFVDRLQFALDRHRAPGIPFLPFDPDVVANPLTTR
jgi:hypothetical protein